MNLLAALVLLSGVFPLAKALRANRATTLWQPLLWAMAAWANWVVVAWLRMCEPGEGERLTAYGALCLTSCAGIAVLGARRPGVSAWNFVVVGLLAVLLLPIFNGMGELRAEPAQKLFLAGTLAIGILNYLPTRLGPNALVAAAACGWEMMRLFGGISTSRSPWLGLFLLALIPWTAWTAVMPWGAAPTEFDRLWLTYRDRFGFVWGQRVREQFNRAAHHAGWPVELRWSGLKVRTAAPTPDAAALLVMLRAVLKRFGPKDENPQRDDERAAPVDLFSREP